MRRVDTERRTIWTNVVTACATCNLWKGNRLPRESGMYPRRRPVQPATYVLPKNGRAFPPNNRRRTTVSFRHWRGRPESAPDSEQFQ
jgi:hypothetical protein